MSSTELPDTDALGRMFTEASQCISPENQVVLSTVLNYVTFNREYLRNPPPCSGFSLAMFLAANRHLPTIPTESAKRVAYLLDTFAKDKQAHPAPNGIELQRVQETLLQLADLFGRSPTLYGPIVTQVNDILDFAQRAVNRTDEIAKENVRLEGLVQQLRDVNEQLVRDNDSLTERLRKAQTAATAAGLI